MHVSGFNPIWPEVLCVGLSCMQAEYRWVREGIPTATPAHPFSPCFVLILLKQGQTVDTLHMRPRPQVEQVRL